jgi:hypothetical protein
MSSNIRVLLEHILPTNKLKAGRYINTNDPKESKNWFFTVGTNTDLELGKYDLQVLSDEMTRGMKHKTEYVRDRCICHAWHIHVYLNHQIMPSYCLFPLHLFDK